MKTCLLFLLFMLVLLTSGESVAAKGVFQTPKAFISASLGENSQVKMLWLTKEDKAVVADILSHKFNRLRIRYWQRGDDSVWILDEVGKEKPITIGVHIAIHQGRQQIQKLKVLTFRESRGDEVRHDFYAKQFINASLDNEKKLTQNIDGITGATLSVRATTKIARLALWLNTRVSNKH